MNSAARNATRPSATRWRRSIGAMNYCILRNHGMLTLGESMPETFTAM